MERSIAPGARAAPGDRGRVCRVGRAWLRRRPRRGHPRRVPGLAHRARRAVFCYSARLAGFTGTYLMLIMVVLIARLPWLESSVGQDRLVRWHRQLAPWAISLITAHVILITLGYAQASSTGLLRELWVLVTSYRDMLAATVGFGLLIMAGISSYRHIRRRLPGTKPGGSFTCTCISGSPWRSLTRSSPVSPSSATRWSGRCGSWSGRPPRGWCSCSGSRSRSGGACGTSSGWSRSARRPRGRLGGLPGRHLDRLAVSGGQFFHWHFLTKGMWWQGHPYSL